MNLKRGTLMQSILRTAAMAAAVALVVGTGTTSAQTVTQAGADTVADCRQSRNSEARIAACSAIIADTKAAAEQKAIAFRNRASARADAGAIDAALADYNEALKLNPADAVALTGRGHMKLSRNEADTAIEDFTTALKLNPASPGILVSRGHAYIVKGLPDLAITDFTEAIKLNPKSASTFNHRGLAYRKKGEIDRAIDDYTTAIGLNPIYALAYNNRGYANEAKGNKPLAIEDFSRALLIDGSLAGAAAGLKRLGATGPMASDVDTLTAKGRTLVEANCSRCHATGAAGTSPNAKAPEFRTLQQRHPLLALREPLSRGIAATHEEMPKFKLSDADLDSIVAYINSLPAGGAK